MENDSETLGCRSGERRLGRASWNAGTRRGAQRRGNIDRLLGVSAAAYAIAMLAAFVSPRIAIVVIFLGAIFARSFAHHVLTPRGAPQAT